VGGAAWGYFRRAVDDVRARVRAELPSDQQDTALERVDEIEGAITADEPDLTTMQLVRRWFRRHVPQMAGALTGLIIHPVVGKIVEAAGDLAAQQLQDQIAGE
jgi:hypothetical protein